MFHTMFPAITVGLSILLTILYGICWKTRKAVCVQMFRSVRSHRVPFFAYSCLRS